MDIFGLSFYNFEGNQPFSEALEEKDVRDVVESE